MTLLEEIANGESARLEFKESRPKDSLKYTKTVVAAIMQTNPNAQEWKDVAAQVKTNLVGVIRPIDVPEMHVTKLNDGEELTTYEFKPLLGETGKPVIRAITEADIDALGEAVMSTIFNG